MGSTFPSDDKPTHFLKKFKVIAGGDPNNKEKVSILRGVWPFSQQERCFKLYCLRSEQSIQSYENEASFAAKFTQCNNPHLVKIYNTGSLSLGDIEGQEHILEELGLSANEQYVKIEMDYYEQGTLQIYRTRLENPHFRPQRSFSADSLVQDVYDQVLFALQDIWNRDFIHKDLKPENIFMIQDGPIGYAFLLGDFGSSIQLKQPHHLIARETLQIGSTHAYVPTEANFFETKDNFVVLDEKILS